MSPETIVLGFIDKMHGIGVKAFDDQVRGLSFSASASEVVQKKINRGEQSLAARSDQRRVIQVTLIKRSDALYSRVVQNLRFIGLTDKHSFGV